MRIDVDIEEGNAVVQSVACEAEPEETIEQFANRLADQLGAEVEDILDGLGSNGNSFQRKQRVSECTQDGHRWKHRRVCIDLHFESEAATHRFSPRTQWGRVHQWGCRDFHVANDACANLELRDGGPEGPALNEKLQIGAVVGCKTVWLVSPGPEPNGHYR